MEFPKSFPMQEQKHQPGFECEMNPRPIFDHPSYNKKGDTFSITFYFIYIIFVINFLG